MKVFFGMILIAFAAQQSESAALKSVIRDGLVSILEAINGAAYKVENYANDYFLDKLQNETQIKEWSVNIQADVFDGIATLAFSGFEAYKAFALLQTPSALESKALNCISDQESALLAAVDDASRQNGWCNNRLAYNLTVAFQEVSGALLDVNTELKEDAASLESCLLGDDICVTAYVTKVVALITAQAVDEGDTVKHGLSEVERIYKIMFGEDVPRCNEEYLFPLLGAGVRAAFLNALDCIVN